MSHFWLKPDEQALMDSATSTAHDYGHIGLFSVGKAWKRRVEGMVGSKVEASNYLRAFNVTGSVHFKKWGLNPSPDYEVRAVIRLTKKQAMMMKLRHGGSDEAWVRDDPTGEFWGNMLIGQHVRKTEGWRHQFYRRADDAMLTYLEGGSFGPTVDNVADSAAGLDDELKAAFVWYNVARWDEAGVVLMPDFNAIHGEGDETGQAAWDAFPEAWSMPSVTQGKQWARDFWKDCQQPWQRKWLLGNV